MTKNSHDLSIIILAAGKGTRMKSELPKVMHKVAGREMLNMVIDEAQFLEPKNITVVVSEEMKLLEEKIYSAHPKTQISLILQKERKGTAHAVQSAVHEIKYLGKKVLVLYGDTPLIQHQTLKKMVEKLDDFSLCVLAFDDEEVNAYGRLVVDSKGHVERIVEFKDATDEERKIALCNSGVMSVDGSRVKEMLSQVKNQNAAGEYYLTDLVAIAGEMGLKRSFIKTEMFEVLGVNSRVELARVEEIKQDQIRTKMMNNGVTLINPHSIHFAFDTKIGSDVIIHSNVVFGSKVTIEKNVEIKSFSHIEGAKIASGSVVGPFARLRPGTELAENVRIGNFVEVKKSQIKRGAKVNHLSYIGDSEIGEDSNIGAGTITCNYDGYNKFKTTIGKNVFVGSNSALVAPVEIADGAVIAAGSVITKNVEPDDLAVARGKQTNISQGGKKFHATKSQDKK
jgi:bifunctional UDP-N-acetylglucosamine pyrophosphorylase/glucosamine-1-phosphate N-acetyltransferase